MRCDRKLESDSDAAFRREGTEEAEGGFSGRAVKGAVFVRWGTTRNGEKRVHLLDWLQGQLKQVSRATFTSETLACINAVDQMIVLAILLHQLSNGAITLDEARRLTDGKGNHFETGINIDAMSVLTALEAVNLRQPSEKSFLAHLAWLQDKIKTGTITWLRWVDTRDMYADGLTKGSVRRDRLRELATGRMSRAHETKKLHMRYNNDR